ncbi:valine--tRNA ligase [Candidatus Saccharibacteria bacterium]|nr:valine--tRNA ligase [Candidatus Saccharibacteria bacterium]
MKFSKAYEPNENEPIIYALWEGENAFAPSGTGQPYSTVMPPPNANGNLHIGHGFEMGLKDILVRYHRMKGFDTIYIPGADHAGFETWVVYERELEKIGQSRFDFSRDQLYGQVWDFVAKQRGNMELQIRALGISCSWQDLVFTLDKKVVDTVYDTFKRMWEDGLIYRGEKIVNYCTEHQTSFADIEVDHQDDKGYLWDIAYPLVDGSGEVVISTTRPETLLGDTAVAVNPKDKRYAKLVGKKVKLPLTDRKIPIIADEHADMTVGTGAVKITPAHDPNDFEVGERHNLPRIQVIGFDGLMVSAAGDSYRGLTAIAARDKVLDDLEKLGLRRGEKAITHSVGHCYKCGSVIEPLPMEQWFVKVKPLAKQAIAAIENGDIKFYPNNKGKVLVGYYKNLRDWNISRQIPWGIPIPMFSKFEEGDNAPEWVFDTRVDQTEIVVNGTTYTRDEDTLDTWFSSGQWPFITTGYLDDETEPEPKEGKNSINRPGQTPDLARFYPNTVMENGIDLLFPWDSRMIMLGLYRTNQVPWKDLYVHGMVLDESGQKMSKSKGNVVSPMEMIAKYGSDAFRMGIIAGRSAGMSQAFSKSNMVAARNFCNKLWNIARFVQDKLEESYQPHDMQLETSADHWIVRQLNAARRSVESNLAAYRFAEASEAVYQTIWNDVADWYVEANKTTFNPDVLAFVLETSLKLAHPFAPFVTEAIWQNLSWTDNLLIKEHWPEKMHFGSEEAKQFESIKQLVTEVRLVTNQLPGNKRYNLLFQSDQLIDTNRSLIKQLAPITEVQDIDVPHGMRLAVSGHAAWLDIDARTLKHHHANLVARLAAVEDEIARLDMRLHNDNYIKKAPGELVEETKHQLTEAKKLLQRLKNELEITESIA